ncbi:MAG: chromosome partitioning protein (plasmid) [Methyloprofundus sp.]|nr:MAG: chromosome partitioning protein [Methyloprofundus sp.]
MIILLGGILDKTGKTTLATNLAVIRASSRRDVLLIDTSTQGSTDSWTQIRGGKNINPRVSCIQKFGKGLLNEVKDLATRYQDIIIDAGGQDSIELRSALVVVEKVYIPIQPSQFDILTLSQMDELIESAKEFNPSLQAKIIINRASKIRSVHESEVAVAKKLLANFKNLELANVIIRDQIYYAKSAIEGLSVIELNPKEAQEIEELYQEVFFANNKISQNKEPYSWEQENVREDVTKVYNLRLSESYLLKLKYIAEHTPDSMQKFCINILEKEIDNKINELKK